VLAAHVSEPLRTTNKAGAQSSRKVWTPMALAYDLQASRTTLEHSHHAQLLRTFRRLRKDTSELTYASADVL
jgi:hypothetical protein